MKMFSVAHKTVFVVDHCPYMSESSRQQVNYIVSDSEFHILNSWRREDQSTHE
ncbi:hypothetical protein XENOCAPTIV_026114, partial [Xenoophorus captivus]